ncbi:pentapeptide repeat-containing protein [Vibrio parahaemolyticus]|uniref:pentapeptide repeat-containing protein n=1 Tax=Vibrio parahaemolyticus TaxID=670 RepID=UPI002119D82E|nr:pentapeptide repeat-containing protein [Vibrio parahaemolyticus]MCQ9077366.1 pentapeptide repeat-containing protein [Vibrio parahaemolyticus]
MDKSVFDFKLKQPVSVWNREVSIDFKEFFTALGKSVVSGVFLDYKGVCENLVDSAKSAGLTEQPAPVLAWELINVALLKSISELVCESKELFEEVENSSSNAEELAQILFAAIKNHKVAINSEFFDKPQELELLEKLEQPITDWLILLGIPQASSYAIYLRLKDRFAMNLHSEWVSEPAKYAAIEEALVSPFLTANQEIRNWTRYKLWLQQEANKPVFSEAFGLQQVYIPLRGYYNATECLSDEELDEELDEKATRSRSPKKLVVDVHKEIARWISDCNIDDPLKVISGGPGSGKSSFAKILAAKVAKETPELPVLFIPLHHFDIDGDLTEAVDKFIAGDRYLTSNPLDSSNGCSRLLVIFDGLDELSMRGKAASDSAKAFVEEVLNQFNRYNAQGHKRQAIITGRDMAVQSSSIKLRKPKQVLHLLPYFVEKTGDYLDPDMLLNNDQRNDWWVKYSRAKGLDYQEFPTPLNTKKLEPITAEPLLNYLVALTYEGGRVDFSNEVTLNTIYSDLLEAVHKRQWDHGNHKSIDHLEKKDFLRILEEIALAVWHGHGRTATSASIFNACESAKLTPHLEKFQEGSKKGISRLLTAFYFRESDSSSGADSSFEFTHKSFGEYLISKRIVRQLDITFRLLAQHDEEPDLGKDETELLLDWTKICGPNPIDEYIYEFLKNEIISKGEVRFEWLSCLKRLIEVTLTKGILVDRLPMLSFSEMKQYSDNALESLFILQHFCRSGIHHKYELLRLSTHKQGHKAKVSEQLTSILNVNSSRNRDALLRSLTGCDFSFLRLNQVNLSYGNISESAFRRTSIQYSYANQLVAENCNFTSALMNGSVFNFAELSGSNFRQVRMRETKLKNCNISFADFSESKLRHSQLTRVTAVETNFSHSEAEYINLAFSDLRRAKFYKSDLTGADLSNTDLSGADLTGAKIEGIKLASVVVDENTILDVDTEGLTKLTLSKLEKLKEKQKSLKS